MDNPAGSINFDANALYMAEAADEENDDVLADKQQENELKELISQGGLDGILDDEEQSLASSSDDSSFNENDTSSDHAAAAAVVANPAISSSPSSSSSSSSSSANIQHQQHMNAIDVPITPANHHHHHHQQQQQKHGSLMHQHMSSYAMSLDYRSNQYSTPSNMQSAPPPSTPLLQATIPHPVLAAPTTTTINNNNQSRDPSNSTANSNTSPTMMNGDTTVRHVSEPPVHVPNKAKHSHSLEKFACDMHEQQQAMFSKPQQHKDKDQQQQQQQQHSMIDLNELTEAELNELKAEEAENAQQAEYYTRDQLYRHLLQVQFLYKVRGHKLSDMQDRFSIDHEAWVREKRGMTHQLHLAEQGRNAAEASVAQMRELCVERERERDTWSAEKAEMLKRLEEARSQCFALEHKLQEQEQHIESLLSQINEHERLDAIARLQHQHEMLVQQMREQQARDRLHADEQLGALRSELADKSDYVHKLREQLDAATKNGEQAALERADTVTRLNKALNDAQTKHDRDLLMWSAAVDEQQSNARLLADRCRELEAAQQQSNTTTTTPSSSNNNNNNELQLELERLRAQLEQQRQQQHDEGDSVEKVNELQRVVDELSGELAEKSAALNEALGKDEQWQQMKSEMELDAYNKQRHIEECEQLIHSLEAERAAIGQQQQRLGQLAEYEAQIGELNLKLANRDNELHKVRDMYIEVCNDKNNLQDTLKVT